MRQVAFLLMLATAVFTGAAPRAHAAEGPCDGAPHRAFDFWLGDWEVRTPDGKLAGHNRISAEYGSCVVHERYTTARGYAGESLNAYDPARKAWHQTWVDNSGTVLLLDGGLEGESMVLAGDGVDAEGRPIRQRITWTPAADGSVRQLWEASDAEGRWKTVFDGTYRRQGADAGAE